MTIELHNTEICASIRGEGRKLSGAELDAMLAPAHHDI